MCIVVIIYQNIPKVTVKSSPLYCHTFHQTPKTDIPSHFKINFVPMCHNLQWYCKSDVVFHCHFISFYLCIAVCIFTWCSRTYPRFMFSLRLECHNELSIFVWQIYRKPLQNLNICVADILILLLYIMYLLKRRTWDVCVKLKTGQRENGCFLFYFKTYHVWKEKVILYSLGEYYRNGWEV